ncbi:MAG TPA: HlyD family efflux transporter periplasmic adaptor subunit [Nitrospiria bacterium]|nr:HlyD family efflux transporter periplasmic adaptor subunit [Nitrospiria bacterium]
MTIMIKWLKKYYGILAGLAIIFILVLIFWPKPVEVEVSTASLGSFQQTVREDGKTRTRNRYVVSAPLSGTLQRIALKAGDSVEKDQIVAVLIPSVPPLIDVRTGKELRERVGSAESSKKRAETSVERAKVSLDHARSEYERIRELANNNFVSKQDLEIADLAVKLGTKELEAAIFQSHGAEHDLEGARAALARYQREAVTGKSSGENWEIRSPVSGKVLRVFQENEGVVNSGAPILEMGNPEDLEIVVDVLTSDAVLIQPGAEVSIQRWGGNEPLKGRVRLIEPSGFTKVSALGIEEQRVNVIIDIISPVEKWRSLEDGFQLDAEIITFRSNNAVTLPASSLFKEADQWSVYLFSNGRIKKRSVVISHRSGLEAMVEKGIEPGEKVVIYPGDAVKDGIRVKLKK